MPPALAMPALSGKGRVAATISNDLGPPIFMPCKLFFMHVRISNILAMVCINWRDNSGA